jgi:hypothetical protein
MERLVSNEYTCEPAPKIQPDHSPVIGTNELTHYFLKPHKLELPQRSTYKQLPKRSNGQLIASAEETVLGWGLHLKEGWHWPCIVTLTFLFTFVPVVFGIIWSVVNRDIPGGFAITATWVALGPVLIGYITVRDSYLAS